MTKSKKIRAYLAKHPDASAKDLQTRFNCSVSMAYRLIQETKKPALEREIKAVIDYFTLSGQDKMADDAHKHLDDLENAATLQQMKEDAKKSSPPSSLGVNIWQSPVIEMPKIPTTDNVNHPPHYKIGGIETIDFIEAKGLDNHYHLANAIKYISRAPYKNNYLEDVKKAAWYLQREIERHENPSFLR